MCCSYCDRRHDATVLKHNKNTKVVTHVTTNRQLETPDTDALSSGQAKLNLRSRSCSSAMMTKTCAESRQSRAKHRDSVEAQCSLKERQTAEPLNNAKTAKKTEESEKVSREAKEKLAQTLEEGVRGRKRRVALVRKRACCGFPISRNEKGLGKGVEEEVVDLSGEASEHWCEVSVCVLASVSLVLSLISLVNDVNSPSVAVSDWEIVESQTFSLSRKRDAGVALECEAKMNIEGPAVKAVPEAVRNSPTPQSSLFKAVPE